MLKLLIMSLTISLIIVGIHATTWHGMIFNGPAEWLKKRLPVWICKPLFACAICMSSIWGTMFFLVFNTEKWYYLPVVILITAGINTVFTAIISDIIPDE